MSVTVNSSPPCSFTAGDTVAFTVSGNSYPSSLWHLDYVLSRNGSNILTSRATASGADHTVSIAAADTAIVPGPALSALVFTKIADGERKTVCHKHVSILYNPAAALSPTAKQTLLAALDAALLKLGKGIRKVNFDGQEVEFHDIARLTELRNQLTVEVQNELRAMGIPQPGGAKRIQARFR